MLINFQKLNYQALYAYLLSLIRTIPKLYPNKINVIIIFMVICFWLNSNPLNKIQIF